METNNYNPSVHLKQMEIHFKINEMEIKDLTPRQKKILIREIGLVQMAFDDLEHKWAGFSTILANIGLFK